MAMLIVFTIFGLFWLGTTLASITYMVFKNSKSLTQTLEEHPPFWLQDYYAFLNRYHKPLLIGSIVMGIGLTIWGINSQEKQYDCQSLYPNYESPAPIRICQPKYDGETKLETMYIQLPATPKGGTDNLYR